MKETETTEMENRNKSDSDDQSTSDKVHEMEAGTKHITPHCSDLNSDRLHVKTSVEEWMNASYTTIETITLDETDIPKFEFNVKVRHDQNHRDVYIPSCAVSRLKQIRDLLKTKGIPYTPPNVVQFAFDHVESQHWLTEGDIPAQKTKKFGYREPVDEHVARQVVNAYHTTEDALDELSESDVIYYFLSALKCLNCHVLNTAMQKIRIESTDNSLYQSAILPVHAKRRNSADGCRYYSLYADVIHFLGLMSPPILFGHKTDEILAMVKRRNVEQTKILCDSIGIANHTIADRGREWLKVVKFFDANPRFCAIMGTTIVESTDAQLTVIEKQTLDQVTDVLSWRKMHHFHDCFTLATDKRFSNVYKMRALAEQCGEIRLQYRNWRNKRDKRLIPFMSFYLTEKELLEKTDIERYPELFYAAVSSSVKSKKGNFEWEHFVATRPAKIERDAIDQLLAVEPVTQNNDGIQSSAVQSNSTGDESGKLDGENSEHFCVEHDDLRADTKSVQNGDETCTTFKETRNNMKDSTDSTNGWETCEGDINPVSSGPFNLESHLKDDPDFDER